MSEYSIHEVRNSGHLKYEIRRELTQYELRAIYKYASDKQISFADALQVYLDEVQMMVDIEVRKKLENDILFGVMKDLGEGNRAPYLSVPKGE